MSLKFPKPEAKPKKRTGFRAKRKDIRFEVIMRDGRACRACGSGANLQVHEEPPRSLGGDPLDPKHCLTLCAMCHRERTENRMRIYVLDLKKGTVAPVRFHQNDKMWQG